MLKMVMFNSPHFGNERRSLKRLVSKGSSLHSFTPKSDKAIM